MEYNYNPYMYNQVGNPRPTNNVVRVTGIEGAKAYQLAPNSSVALFDGNEDIFFFKSTDGAGFPTIRAFEFSEIPLSSLTHVIDTSQYVNIEDFNTLKESVEKLVKELGGNDGEQSI